MNAVSEQIQSLSDDIQRMKQDIAEFLEAYYHEIGPYYRDVTGEEITIMKPERVAQDVQRHYRALARKWHPDMCMDEAQKTHYRAMFDQVQAAYERHDVVSLKALRNANETMAPEETMLTQLKSEYEALKTSPEYALAKRHFRAKLCGVNLIDEIATKMRRHYSYQSHKRSLGLVGA